MVLRSSQGRLEIHMPWGDIVNGCFEAIGGLAVFANVRRIVRDKGVQGIDLRATALFTSWGMWNLVYYPSLNQWVSFAGGVVIVVGNAIWLSLALYYARTKEGRNG